MSLRNYVHHLSDIVEDDIAIDWQRDWQVLFVALVVTLLTGPCLILGLWIQDRNVRNTWDAKDHWKGTKQFALTLAIVDGLLVLTFIHFNPALSSFGPRNGWWWICTHLTILWICWALLAPTFALLLERIDPRTLGLRRVLLPSEQQPPKLIEPITKRKARKKSRMDTSSAAPKKQKKEQSIPLEQAAQQKDVQQTRVSQPQLLPDSSVMTSRELSEQDSNDVSPVLSKPLSPYKRERRKPESLDSLF